MFSRGRGGRNHAPLDIDSHDSFISLISNGSSHSLHPNQGHSSLFLPSYLLGDSQSPHYSVSSPRWGSSGTNHGLPQTPVSHSNLMSMNVSGKNLPKGHVGAPPVSGLYSNPTLQDTPYTRMPGYSRTQSSPTLKKMHSPTRIAVSSGLRHSTEGLQGSTSLEMLNQRQGVSVSQSQGAPFHTQGSSQTGLLQTQGDLNSSDVLDETWITVFGYPSGATSFILQQFSQYGTIIKHIIISECNWMHIHYMTKIQAKKALSKNGRIYGGSMKIGVVPCTEKSVMEERSRHLQDSMSASTSDTGFGSHTPLRPLTAAYVATRSDYEVIRGKPVPKRDESFVSKLKEYVFGY